MKKLLVIFLLLFVFHAVAFCGNTVVFFPKASSSCDTLTQETTTTLIDVYYTGIGRYGDQKWFAGKFVATTSGDYCAISVQLMEIGDLSSSTKTLTLYIYSNTCTTCDGSDDEPGSQIINATTSFNENIISGSSPVWYKSECANKFNLTSGVTYWCVVYRDGTDSANYPGWKYENGNGTETKYDDDGIAPWVSKNSNYGVMFRLYR